MSSAKTSKILAKRFKGYHGKRRLLEALLSQHLVAGQQLIANAIVRTAQIKEVRAGTEITVQGAAENDIFFILSGSVSVLVNQREIASRQAGDHFGEMALVDPIARRSATIVAKDRVTVAILSEADFSKIANNYPELWRRVAVTLANRLRERNKFHLAPHARPSVFIGSSSEALSVAETIATFVNLKGFVSRIWTEDIFHPSKTTIEDLFSAVLESDYAIIVLTPDDVTKSRGRSRSSPRDNAVFELGLFMGGLSRERTFIVCPNRTDLKIPTDLLGITVLRYNSHGPHKLARRLRKINRTIAKSIKTLGPR